MSKICITRDPVYAPCGYLICRVRDNGTWNIRADDTILVQTDWEFPSLAAALGFIPCECGYTDGTVDCAHKTATKMISAAADYLDTHLDKVIDDPGYFEEN